MSTTCIPHGPLSSDDYTKLTGLSVLLWRGIGEPVLVEFSHHNLMGVHVRYPNDRSRWASSPEALTYLGERPEPGSPVILAPEGGWRSDPIPHVDVADFMMSDGRWYERQRKPRFWHLVGAIRLIEDAKPADRPAQALSDLAGMDALAEAVHRGRFPDDREPTPFADEDAGGREYCYRIARSVAALSATPASPPAETGEGEPFAWFQMWNDGTRYPGDPKLWPPSKRDREYVEQMGRTIVPLYTHPASDQSDTERMRAAANALANEFAWSAVKADCEDARVHLQGLIDTLRAALAEKEAG